jgi:DNA polymerase III epsilon subunit-like protein
VSAPRRRARLRLWNRLRLLVIDVETAVAPGGEHRIVSIAAVTCRAGKLVGTWKAEFVNPGVPIDPVTSSIHGLTDAHVAGAPSFADLADELLTLLTEQDQEDLVVVAHRARFDLPVLRAELVRSGRQLPDLPVLDTAGPLARLAGVAPADASLAALLTALGIHNPAPHTAVADARATAEAACELLNLAADAGHASLRRLLARLDAGRTGSLRFSRPADERISEPELPEAHLAAHGDVLTRRAGKRRIAAWTASLKACAELRCRFAVDRVAAAEAPSSTWLEPLVDAIIERASNGDRAGTATLLGAIGPRLTELPSTGRGQARQASRTAALALEAKLAPVLDPFGRCAGLDRCPSCRAGEPCALDSWRLALAPAALGGPVADRARGFFETSGREAGTGPYLEMRRGHPRLADAALRLVHAYWRAKGQDDIGDLLAYYACTAGCRDPEIGEAHALALAASGRRSDLEAAITVCETMLAAQNGSTDEAWRSLDIRHAQLRGRLRRLDGLPSGRFDADGNPIPKRRHHPAHARRSRPPRFVRA